MKTSGAGGTRTRDPGVKRSGSTINWAQYCGPKRGRRAFASPPGNPPVHLRHRARRSRHVRSVCVTSTPPPKPPACPGCLAVASAVRRRIRFRFRREGVIVPPSRLLCVSIRHTVNRSVPQTIPPANYLVIQGFGPASCCPNEESDRHTALPQEVAKSSVRADALPKD